MVAVMPFETTMAAGTVFEVTIVEPAEFVVVTPTTILSDATAMADVVEVTTFPSLSVLETTTGTITAVDEVVGSAAPVVELVGSLGGSGVDVVEATEIFCLLIRSRAATASTRVANGALTECTASNAALSCS